MAYFAHGAVIVACTRMRHSVLTVALESIGQKRVENAVKRVYLTKVPTQICLRTHREIVGSEKGLVHPAPWSQQLPSMAILGSAENSK